MKSDLNKLDKQVNEILQNQTTDPEAVVIPNNTKESVPVVIKQYIQDNPIPGAKDIEHDVDSKCPTRDLVLKHIYECNKNIFDLKTTYIQFGGHLIELKPFCKYIWSWKKGRYCKNIYEVAEHCFNLGKSTTANIIGITERFGYMMSSLKSEYDQYLYSQLTEMLPLSDEQLKLVHPGMTIQEIRAIKKTSKKVVQTSGQNTNTLINKDIQHFLILKNDTQRIDFLKLYKYWGVWLEVKELGLKFYKCDLSNGDFIVATEHEFFVSKNDKFYEYAFKNRYSVSYQIVKKGTSPTHYGYSRYELSDSNYISYLKTTKAKIVIYEDCKTLEEYKQKMGAKCFF